MGISTEIRRWLGSHLSLFLDLKVLLYTEYSPVNWRKHFKEKKVHLIQLNFCLPELIETGQIETKDYSISFEEKEPIVLFININGREFFLAVSRVQVQTQHHYRDNEFLKYEKKSQKTVNLILNWF